jgi:2'-5' RNA ligase
MSDAEEHPIFATFEEAWSAFLERGHIVPIEHQRERFLRGRAQFLSLQVPIAEMDAAGEIEATCDELEDIDGLILIPRDLLHISVRGVGFQVIATAHPGDILREEVGPIGQRVAKALRGVKPLAIEIGPVNVFPDALILEVRPIDEMRELLRRVDEAIGGRDAFPYTLERYLPHVTIASFRDESVVAALRGRLPPMREEAPTSDRIRRIDYVRWWFTGLDPAEWPELDTIRSYRAG